MYSTLIYIHIYIYMHITSKKQINRFFQKMYIYINMLNRYGFQGVSSVLWKPVSQSTGHFVMVTSQDLAKSEHGPCSWFAMGPWFWKKQLIKVNTQKQQSRIHIHPLACISSPKTSDCRQRTSTKQDSTNFIFSKRMKQKHRPDVTPKKHRQMLPTDCSKAPTQLLHFAPYEAPLQPWSLPFFLFRLGWHYRGLHQCHCVPCSIGEMMINCRICWGIFSCHIFGQTAVFHQEIVSSSQTSDAWLKSR